MLNQLRDFCRERAEAYREQRDFPSVPGTSKLSAALALGLLSPRQCLARLHAEAGNDIWDPKSNPGTWLNELLWREFYHQIAFHFPRVVMGRAFQADTEAIAWGNDAKLFAAWQQGRTGYPIVDAGMRQLWAIGWMHNRVRMIAASFLIKHLLIDWRHGERWFWDTLVDGDYASNGTNWQWVAGTGVDSNMFPRIMAPLKQSEKFDAAGYIRKWVPELADLPDGEIHDPTDLCRPADYPEKIISHKEGRERALEAYRAMKED